MTNLRVTTPGDRQIVLTRDFAAPSRLVFDALTRPELVRRWLGARGWRVVAADIDLRVGGAWRFLSRGPGGAELGHGGIYREIEPGVRLVYTEAYDDQWYPGEALVTAILAERTAGTTATTTMTTMLAYPSRAVRDQVLRFPMARGVGEGYDRLDEVLDTMEGTTR